MARISHTVIKASAYACACLSLCLCVCCLFMYGSGNSNRNVEIHREYMQERICQECLTRKYPEVCDKLEFIRHLLNVQYININFKYSKFETNSNAFLVSQSFLGIT